LAKFKEDLLKDQEDQLRALNDEIAEMKQLIEDKQREI